MCKCTRVFDEGKGLCEGPADEGDKSRGQKALRGSATRANGYARVLWTRVINHEGSLECPKAGVSMRLYVF